jgi:hypothetical protein
MNREPNKEIDILLRKLSGKQNGDIAAAERNSSASSHEHLDADELNAYAENALPVSLRSRYTEHLADCSSCRKTVTQLSLSSTSAIAQPRVEESSPSPLKTFLAALFSPLVIRYAVPAMAVILVVALAWIVVRRQPLNDQVAQNTESQPQGHDSQLNRPAASAVPNESDSPAAHNNEPRSTASSAESKSAPARSEATPVDEKASETGAGNKAPEDRKPDERKGEEAAKNVAAAAPPPSPVTVKAPSTGAADTAQPKAVNDVPQKQPEAKQKAEVEIAKAQNQVQQESNNRRANEQQRSGPSEPKAVQRGLIAGQRNESAREQSRQRAKVAEEDKDTTRDDEAEVRTVAGHKFTKRGSVWVDALYNSGNATTNVSRDSEQYRSLIGDEPGLRTIAEKLSGEIIVVWKGRPYRIK